MSIAGSETAPRASTSSLTVDLEAIAPVAPSPFRAWRALWRGRLSRLGLLLVLAFALLAAMAPVLAPPARPDDPYHMPRDGFRAEPEPPSAEHPLGTTAGQYDVLYGLVWGSRTAFKVGLSITLLTLILGVGLGATAAFLGGWIDELFQRLVEILMAFPFILAAVTLAAVLMPRLHDRVLVAQIALVAFGWTGYARLVRSEVLAVKQRDFVLAARALGASPGWILRKHVLPNALGSVLVLASLGVGDAVLAFSALSFLGIGAEPGYADWGQMLSQAQGWLADLATYWYALVFPGGALVLFAMAFNLLGDAFRDALDPRMRG